jgi:hypothetical protein
MPTNPLSVLPTEVRRYVYAALVLAALAYTAYQAAGGDWLQAIGGLLTALVGGTAVSNVRPAPPPAEDPVADPQAHGEPSDPAEIPPAGEPRAGSDR